MRKHYGYLPPPLRRLASRRGVRPTLAVRYPCLQVDQQAPSPLRSRLLLLASVLEGVELCPSLLSVAGEALALIPPLARGQPEAFLRDRQFAIVREEGSVHLPLAPGWAQKVLDKGWATVHPLARYMAGAIHPGQLVVYAPRDEQDLQSIWKILQAAYWFARGLADGSALPDSSH